MAKPSPNGELRIIAGKWRGRKILFSEVNGLRPTSARIRETLFNWLNPVIHKANCLDLFAGSGALGFEALSRGAEFVCMVERHPKVVHQLQKIKCSLEIDALQIIKQDALTPLKTKQLFDIIFCDPPFQLGLVPEVIKTLVKAPILAPNALIYVETEKKHAPIECPETWNLVKDKTAGEVRYRLYEVCEHLPTC